MLSVGFEKGIQRQAYTHHISWSVWKLLFIDAPSQDILVAKIRAIKEKLKLNFYIFLLIYSTVVTAVHHETKYDMLFVYFRFLCESCNNGYRATFMNSILHKSLDFQEIFTLDSAFCDIHLNEELSLLV